MTEDHRLIKSAKSARDGNVSEASIPDDVRKTARQYATEWYGGLESNTASFRNMENWFSRVILAERDRCVKIADEWSEGEPKDEFDNGICTAARGIANQIRRR